LRLRIACAGRTEARPNPARCGGAIPGLCGLGRKSGSGRHRGDLSPVQAGPEPTDFQSWFGQPLNEETLNEAHQIVGGASCLDASTERIVGYLNRRGIAINVLFFTVFQHSDEKLLSRARLIDPVDVQVQAAGSGKVGESEPWNGEFYVSFGADQNRSWDEAIKYGFVSLRLVAHWATSVRLFVCFRERMMSCA
jgi:hypothetical protein